MKKRSKYSKRSGVKLSLNEDREGAFWQQERGPRYGNSRKVRSKIKIIKRRKYRKELKIQDKNENYNLSTEI